MAENIADFPHSPSINNLNKLFKNFKTRSFVHNNTCNRIRCISVYIYVSVESELFIFVIIWPSINEFRNRRAEWNL